MHLYDPHNPVFQTISNNGSKPANRNSSYIYRKDTRDISQQSFQIPPSIKGAQPMMTTGAPL